MIRKTNDINEVRKEGRAANTSGQTGTNQDDIMETEAGRRFIAREVLQGGAIGAAAGVAWGSFLGLMLALQMQSPSTAGWDTFIASIGLGALIGAIVSSMLLMVIIKVGSGIQRYFAE